MDTFDGHVIYDDLTDEVFHLERAAKYDGLTEEITYYAHAKDAFSIPNLVTQPFLEATIKNGRIIDLGLL